MSPRVAVVPVSPPVEHDAPPRDESGALADPERIACSESNTTDRGRDR